MMQKLQSLVYLSATILCASAALAQEQGSMLQLVSRAPTTVNLAATGTSGQGVVTLQAQVAGVQGHTPTGAVSFTVTNSSGLSAAETVPLDDHGIAVWNANEGLGTYDLSASYSGDPNYLDSQAAQQNFATPDFDFEIPDSNVIVRQGSAWNGSGLMTSLNGFQGDVTLSCGEMPELVTCGLGNTTVHISNNGSAASDVINVSTVGTTVVTVSGLMLISSLSVIRRRRRGYWFAVSSAFALLMLTITGCGAKTRYLQSDGTPRGTYKITITAVSGIISHSKTITLTVQ